MSTITARQAERQRRIASVKGRELMYRESLNEALKEEMSRDASVFVMGEGIAQRGGSYKVTVDLLDEFGPKRVIDTPLAEASFLGAGVGAALVGMRPVVEILFVDFTMLAMDMVVNQVSESYGLCQADKPKCRSYCDRREERAMAWRRNIHKALKLSSTTSQG